MKKKIFLLLLSIALLGSFELMAQWQLSGNTLTGGERLGSNNNFPLIFYTNGSNRGRITETGLWGINTGTAVPAARFHINSSLGQHLLRADVNNIPKLWVNSNGGTSIGGGISSPGVYLTPPANGLYVNGKSGFGTNSPAAKVQVSGNSSAGNPQLLLYEDEYDFARLSFQNSSSSNYFSVASRPAVNNQDARLNFYYSAAGIGNIMTIQGDGNVGIGVDNPTEKLRVNSAAGQAALRVQVDNNTRLMVYGNGGVAIGENPATIPANGLYVNGNVGIGTSDPSYKLSVDGTIQAKEVRVETGWSDYVFDKQYRLRSLAEVESFIKANKHLPGIIPAKDIQQNGLPVAAMQTKMMEKIEELTLYIINQNKEIQHLNTRIDQLQNINKPK